MKQHYSMREAATALGITQPTIRRHLKLTGITPFRIGADHRSRWITADQLDYLKKWLNKEIVVILDDV